MEGSTNTESDRVEKKKSKAVGHSIQMWNRQVGHQLTT